MPLRCWEHTLSDSMSPKIECGGLGVGIGCHWLLLAVAVCWLLLAVAGCSWLSGLLVDAGSHWIRLVDAGLLADVGCCWLWLAVVGFLACWLPRVVLGFGGFGLWTHVVRNHLLPKF